MLRKFADLVTERILRSTWRPVWRAKSRGILNEVAEAADLVRSPATFWKNHGFVNNLSLRPAGRFSSNNQNVLKPYGVWAVIHPFAFLPRSLGPAGRR